MEQVSWLLPHLCFLYNYTVGPEPRIAQHYVSNKADPHLLLRRNHSPLPSSIPSKNSIERLRNTSADGQATHLRSAMPHTTHASPIPPHVPFCGQQDVLPAAVELPTPTSCSVCLLSIHTPLYYCCRPKNSALHNLPNNELSTTSITARTLQPTSTLVHLRYTLTTPSPSSTIRPQHSTPSRYKLFSAHA